MSEQKSEFCGNPVAVGFHIQEKIKDGWMIDPGMPLTFLAFGVLECGFVRDPTAEQLRRDAEPKLSRAEILAKARAARAEKQNQKKEVTPNEHSES